MEKKVFKIRPAGRHVLTIGRDLIKDKNSALLELVKNSYDADAENVEIIISSSGQAGDRALLIKVIDDGEGMDFSTVTGPWLTPSTKSKVGRKFTTIKKRTLQGQKGIGRYAASVLGDELYLRTTKDSEETSVLLDWRLFYKEKYLEDVDVLVDRRKLKGAVSGTVIEIYGDQHQLLYWGSDQVDALISDLRKLISPKGIEDESDVFNITLKIQNLPGIEFEDKRVIEIEPYPVLDYFDYRIKGSVTESGNAKIVFINNKNNEKVKIEQQIYLESGEYCGNLKFDFKIIDKDSDSINRFIDFIAKKGEAKGVSLGKHAARNLLTEISGIAVYRKGFRIRPHGDPGYDWLELDKQRVQAPGIRVGSDRVSGYLEIETEEQSNLFEKANRDGLKENKNYVGLKEIALVILREAENRRQTYLKSLRDDSKNSLERRVENVFDLSGVQADVDRKLASAGLNKQDRIAVANMIASKAKEGRTILREVKEVIALYQGQATLGKVVKIILHEGRNPLSYLKNQIPLLIKWISKLKAAPDEGLLDKLAKRLTNIVTQSQFLLNLFEKIDPLASPRRAKPQKIALKEAIEGSVAIFTHTVEEKGINIKVRGPEKTNVLMWPQDLTQVMINLIDNSIYWLEKGGKKKKDVTIEFAKVGNNIEISFKDNGPGILKEYIDTGILFEAGFSKKPHGTGLGLTIAGEALQRNGGELYAIHSNKGATFLIKIPVAT